MKSAGKPVPVKYGSSQAPSSRWVRARYRDAAATAGWSGSAAASSASRAHAVCEAVDGPAPDPRRVDVALDALAPAAVGVLVPGQPGDRPARRRAPSMSSPAAASAGQHRAGAVDVVDAPAPPPGAVGALLAPAGRRRRGARPGGAAGTPQCDQRLDDVGGDVLGGGVDHLAEVADRQLGHDAPVVVDVEGAPAAVAALHREQPVDAAPDRRVLARQAGRAAGRAAPRRCRRCRGTSRCRTRTTSRPARPRRGISHQSPKRSTSLESSQSRRPGQRRVVRRQPGVAERDRRQRRVPDRRQAGLHAQALAVLDPERAVEARRAPSRSPGGRAGSPARAAR